MIDYIIFGIITGIAILLMVYFMGRIKKKDSSDEPMDGLPPIQINKRHCGSSSLLQTFLPQNY
jgi:hypothetical protein